MTEERLKMINKIAEEMKSIAKVIEKIEEGCYRFEIRLNSVRTTDVFGVTIFLSEAQRSEIEDLVEKCIRKNLDDYRKEFEKL
jgi:hypothetical protein